MLKIILSIIIIFFLFQGIACADYYEWKDEQGALHVTDYPPPPESTQNRQVQQYESGSNYNSASTDKNKQPVASRSPQQVDLQEQVPPPYNCTKICLQDNRNARKACIDDRRVDRDKFHNCMTTIKLQLDDCRKKCKEEENYATTNRDIEKNNVKVSNNHKTSSDTGTLLNAVKFELIDKRDPAEREGYPYPNSWFSYVMHGDMSLNVDRLSILKTKLIEHLGSKLERKAIKLTQFYVMENTVKPSFVKTPSGKQIPYTGPFLPTLISEISMEIDGDFFHGSTMLQMKQGAKATKSALTTVTTMVIDDLIRDMERR